MTSYLLSYKYKVVIDTNIIIAALMNDNSDTACRAILRLAFRDEIKPMIGHALFCEYEDVINRDYIYSKSPMTLDDRNEFLDDFLSICEWNEIHYLWRPNLTDEGDNHLVELAVASGASYIITQNIRDLQSGDLNFDTIKAMHPVAFLNMIRDEQDKKEIK